MAEQPIRRKLAVWGAVLLVTIGSVLWVTHGYWRSRDSKADSRFLFYKEETGHLESRLVHALQHYALEHDGIFPKGQRTPQASLSMLYPRYAGADLLMGNRFPRSRESRPYPGPEACAWQYVEGLNLNDDPDLAILWDEIEIGEGVLHREPGSHTVYFLRNAVRSISADIWPDFLAKQQELLGKRDQHVTTVEPILIARIHLPSGELIDHFDGRYFLHHEYDDLQDVRWGSGYGGGSSLPMGALRWYRNYPVGELRDGTTRFWLELPENGLFSEWVTVQLKDGIASPRSIIFNMQVRAANNQ